MNRRSFIGLMLAMQAAPAIVKASSLMRIKPATGPWLVAYGSRSIECYGRSPAVEATEYLREMMEKIVNPPLVVDSGKYTTIRVGLPTTTWRLLHEGVNPMPPLRYVIRVPKE